MVVYFVKHSKLVFTSAILSMELKTLYTLKCSYGETSIQTQMEILKYGKYYRKPKTKQKCP